MKLIARYLTASCAAAMLLASCFNDKASELYPGSGPCDTTNVTFNATILPIFQQNCALPSCHKSGSALGGYTLDVYSGAKQAVDANRLLGAINHESGFSPMPKGAAQLDECRRRQIAIWVAAGAPNN